MNLQEASDLSEVRVEDVEQTYVAGGDGEPVPQPVVTWTLDGFLHRLVHVNSTMEQHGAEISRSDRVAPAPAAQRGAARGPTSFVGGSVAESVVESVRGFFGGMEFCGEVLMRRLMLAIRPGVWVAAVAMLVTGGIVAAPATPAMAASGCVTETFTTADQNTFLTCVKDGQVLLNNIRIDMSTPNGTCPPLPDITVDGFYGPQTESDVQQFQTAVNCVHGFPFVTVDGKLGPQTWWWLCDENTTFGFQGTFWHNAGCATEGPNPPPA